MTPTPTPRPMLTLIREHPIWTAFIIAEVIGAIVFVRAIRSALPDPDDGPLDHALGSWACGPQDRAGGPIARPQGVGAPPAHTRRCVTLSADGSPLLTLHADADDEAVEAIIRASRIAA